MSHTKHFDGLQDKIDHQDDLTTRTQEQIGP